MNFELKIENGDGLLNLFKQLSIVEQNSLIKETLNDAAAPIINQAFLNYNSSIIRTRKNNINPSITGTLMKNKAGIIVGVTGKYDYIMRWKEWGTKLRQTGGRTRGNTFKANAAKATDKLGRSAHSTGVMPPSHFFFNAVKDRQNTSAEILSQGIISAMDKIINGNNK